MKKTDIEIYRGLKEKFDPQIHIGFFITTDTGELLIGDQSLGQTISAGEVNDGVLTLKLNTGDEIAISFPEATEDVKGLLSPEDKNKLASLTQNLDNKVDKVEGKNLSTEDYTTAEKEKLENIEEGAQVNTITSVNGRIGNIEGLAETNQIPTKLSDLIDDLEIENLKDTINNFDQWYEG